jgi:hypothetical protein
MRRWITALVLPLIVAVALTGCSKTTTASGTPSTGATASACPTTEQGTLVKTRFAVDLGLIVGTTHHFIYDAFKQGKFTKGAPHRLSTIIKAGIAAAAVVHLAHNAINNAKADPLLCNALIQPLTDLTNALDGIKSKLFGGDFSSLTNLGGTLTGIETAAKGQGLNVVRGLIPGL